MMAVLMRVVSLSGFDIVVVLVGWRDVSVKCRLGS